MNGGYLMVSKADTKIYDKLQLGLKVGKPILWYENETTCYYIDSISGGEITSEIVDDEEVITYGDIILTKGGKTITVSYDGTDATVTESGDIENPLMENIKDLAGNLRFIEGEPKIETISGVTIKYNKWSLSGSHLMIVLAGTIDDATTISVDTLIGTYSLPTFIMNKIFAMFGAVVQLKFDSKYADDWSKTDFNYYIRKDDVNNVLEVKILSGFTTTAADNFRIQFDLLIDAE